MAGYVVWPCTFYAFPYNQFMKGSDAMKLTIQTDENIEDLKIEITCRQLTPEVERIIAAIRMLDHQLTGNKNGEVHLLEAREIIYAESVDRKCFLYTDRDVYESALKLYELELQLASYGFFRISKSMLINLQNIKSLKADINRKLRVTMTNGEQIIASRQYADDLKTRIGVK